MGDNGLEKLNIQWFPGHMTKAGRMISANVSNVDAVCELLDARIPLASRNPDIDSLAAGKPRLVLLNRADLADPGATALWKGWFARRGLAVLETDSRSGRGVNGFAPAVRSLLAELLSQRAAKGQATRALRVMVLGIPNVGKSTFINRVAGKKAAAVSDRPGVTRQNRWFTVGKGFELLDTPGVLWPKFEDPIVGEHLAFTGAVRDEILDMESLAARLLELLMELYPNAINSRYKTDIRPEEHLPGHELLERVGRKRGMLVSGGEVNTERAAITVLDEYRGGKLGRITLERP